MLINNTSWREKSLIFLCCIFTLGVFTTFTSSALPEQPDGPKLQMDIHGFATNMVEINTASLQQLDEIMGVGPVIGQRIIDARPFSSVDDLLRVNGIGQITLQKMKDQGLVYVEGQIQPIVSWPAQYSAAVLQSSTNLNGAWQEVTNSRVIVGDNVQVVAPAGSSQNFFRLLAP